MAFPAAFIDELIARNPIDEVVGQYVQLKRSGTNYFGLCPFHGEKTASFSVAPNKQMYYCFGCHKGGGVINFIMEIEGLSYPDAVRFLAKRANLEVPEDERYESQYKEQERLWKLCRDAAKYYHELLKSDAGKNARTYLKHRGLDWPTIVKFGMGFAPDDYHALIPAMERKGYSREELIAANLAAVSQKNTQNVYDRFRNRIMFPQIDLRGNVIGFAGRALDKDAKAKYINPTETLIFSKRKFLYAMNLAKKSKRPYIILCEGPMDAIACHQYGFDCAVASQGTALTEDQVNIISKYTDQVIMTYDNDAAGQNATQRAIQMFGRAGVKVKILKLHDAKDADEFLHKFGADPFEVLIQGSENQADYRLLSLENQYDLTKDEQRVEFSAKAAELISTFQSSVEREIYADRAAKAAGISKEAMLLEVGKAFKKRIWREKRKKEREDLSPVSSNLPTDRTLRSAYGNPRSAAAEESVIGLALLEPGLLDQSGELTGDAFSVPFLGRAFDCMVRLHRDGLRVSLSALQDFTPEENNRLSAISQRFDRVNDERGFTDCVAVILEEHGKLQENNTDESLLALASSLKKNKGYGGT
ncbi:MAG: DNA primase [Oscillospiraceae bacterium]|nr:DNA primase [Oscillospiraceae bacterium]MBR4655542.1 DNA primase [Oscillospiraceae bacterium]